MTQDIDKLVEMALEFGDIADDPTDPEFQAMMVGETTTVYVPIVSDKFWDAVTHGIQLKMVAHPRTPKEDVYFEQGEAVHQAAHLAWLANNETYEPRQGVVILAEKKVLKPDRPGATMVQQIAARSGIIKVSFIEPFIHPKEMFAAILGSDEHWATPIRKFIADAKAGVHEPAIPAATHKGGRYGKPTREAWQHAVLRYVQNLLNYSSNYYDYLVDAEEQAKLGKTVVGNATKLGLQPMLHWNGKRFMEWIYSLLPPTRDPADTGISKDEDIENIVNSTKHEGTDLPFYRLMKKYTENTAYGIHSGKESEPFRSTDNPNWPGR